MSKSVEKRLAAQQGELTDAAIIKFAREFRDGILDGRSSYRMCAAVCWPLVAMLNMSGVDCDAVESQFDEYNHVWIRLADGRVLDPTCDQFNELLGMKLPTVYLGSPIDRLHKTVSKDGYE